MRRIVLLLCAALWLPASAAHAVECEGDVTARELLEATDEANRGESSVATVEMHVKTKRYERTMKMQSWAKGDEQTLIRILEPAKDAGMATLKSGDNIWNYLPRVDRTMKVPSGMMSNSWMGSHFTNDDLVAESQLAEDYTYEIAACPEGGGEGNYVVSATPRPDAPVVWGEVRATVRPDMQPVKIEYFDESGELVRTMAFSDYTEFGDRLAPATMTLTPADEEGEFTRMHFEDMQFDAEIDDSRFTLQALKQ